MPEFLRMPIANAYCGCLLRMPLADITTFTEQFELLSNEWHLIFQRDASGRTLGFQPVYAAGVLLLRFS